MTTPSMNTVLEAVEMRVLPPDPDVMAAIGLSHTLNTAVADLIDNSLDATANKIVVRFMLRQGRPSSLLIMDNGFGMSEQAIDAAMTVGRRHHYDGSSLGHYGMGLKAASFSQAESLTVIARDQFDKTHHTAGRRWSRQGVQNFECEVLESSQCAEQLDLALESVDSKFGTMVRWDNVRTFPSGTNENVVNEYLSRTIDSLRFHLGFVLHRLIEKRNIRILIDVYDADTGTAGAPRIVDAVNPFAYRRSGDGRYPMRFSVEVGPSAITATAHLWPARSQALEFRLNEDPVQRQGFYFYRNDRLLEAGGWKNIFTNGRRTQLARVELDIDSLPEVFDMNMEKSSVQPRPEFGHAVERAVSESGVSFSNYLNESEAVFRTGNVRSRKREAVVRPGSGFSPAVKRAVDEEYEESAPRPPVQVRWKAISSGEFFEVDRAEQTLWLNERYRKTLSMGRRSGMNDAPLLKASLYLLMEEVFRGSAFGAKAKDNVEIWQAILTDAAEDELARSLS
ncbi:ATP-binding protein [Rhodococcus sp. IEGM 1341]|uniref:ATP-binding protein n=1 Tax=Rhodococcus sp. IEGM 1341 TaxID=3047090 RepID=UPI0024B8093A|nr:ATP-binding protein [Rhodococcus sp. IEGM 1341]MDI9927404.1 ATP-binding protein [Rhodococcus sp. IEGM 1341]